MDKKYVCQKCQCEYDVIPDVWVNKTVCKKCQQDDLAKFDSGWGHLIRVVALVLLVVIVVANKVQCHNDQDDYKPEHIPRSH